MQTTYRDFQVRDWQPADRQAAATVIRSVLAEYGLGWEPSGADQDVMQVEQAYLQMGGQFWVVENGGQIIGTAAYYPITRGDQAVEIRKMYLLPAARGQGLGRFLLAQLEQTIVAAGYREIWIETATVLRAAVRLYEQSGYQPATGVETDRCDRIYCKRMMPLNVSAERG
ncbi:GNAT family N-acetyltransferase [filamentous cyanobacterium LEGE 11480]|uniref:GNAT family N-acetyltransferase n=1 Tax=Romeriopsis navalis LEGE 11480 TaxID=2777977 RepID=A0A928VLL7_9CYAN|nr:GNAT family N-acetyltransferase [Romeriopsis navalis]MBE9029978.1 GNAT family N-acetyltransferase [Romeriopsis navalis LEGE 11480]